VVSRPLLCSVIARYIIIIIAIQFAPVKENGDDVEPLRGSATDSARQPRF